MDEILASIRRIIESGDERQDADGSTLLSISPEAEIPADSRPEDAPTVAIIPTSPVPPFDIHYFPAAHAEEVIVGRHSPVAEPPLDDRPFVEVREDVTESQEFEAASSEEIAPQAATSEARSADGDALDEVSDDAWWDAAVADANDIEAELGEVEVERAVDPAPAQASLGDLPSAGNENAAPAPDSAALRSKWDEASREPSPVPDAVVGQAGSMNEASREAEPVLEPAVQPEADMLAVPVDRSIRSDIPESVIVSASALLSTQAGDQVAAAFDDLTRAIRDGQMRSMEGMAREIMRPMLQEWLDDNLPRIVERLVREEIERIARGPRR